MKKTKIVISAAADGGGNGWSQSPSGKTIG